MFNKLSKTTIDRITVGKTLFIVGILFLIDPILQTLNLYNWYGRLGTLFLGWFLTLLGASLISLRASAWTFLFWGLFLFFIPFMGGAKENKGFQTTDHVVGVAYAFYSALIIAFHILLGLILAIISFQERKNRQDDS